MSWHRTKARTWALKTTKPESTNGAKQPKAPYEMKSKVGMNKVRKKARFFIGPYLRIKPGLKDLSLIFLLALLIPVADFLISFSCSQIAVPFMSFLIRRFGCSPIYAAYPRAMFIYCIRGCMPACVICFFTGLCALVYICEPGYCCSVLSWLTHIVGEIWRDNYDSVLKRNFPLSCCD